MSIDLMPHDQLMQELARERFAPVLPPPRSRYQTARQAETEPRTTRRRRRTTGTGWPA